MKHFTLPAALLVAAVLCLLAATVYGRQASTSARQTWEYKQSCKPKDDEMNRLGAEGWEMVTGFQSGNGVTCLFYKRAR